MISLLKTETENNLKEISDINHPIDDQIKSLLNEIVEKISKNDQQIWIELEELSNLKDKQEMIIDVNLDNKNDENDLYNDNLIINDFNTNSKCYKSDLFLFEVICNCCNSKSSLFWRRVASEKIVCNTCFYNKTYLLEFNDSKLTTTNKNPDEISNDFDDQPITYEKKTRSSSKKLQSSSNTNTSLKSMSSSKQNSGFNSNKTLFNLKSNKPKSIKISSSNSTSSSSPKLEISNQIDFSASDVSNNELNNDLLIPTLNNDSNSFSNNSNSDNKTKESKDLEEFDFDIKNLVTRKSARFLSKNSSCTNSSKSKTNNKLNLKNSSSSTTDLLDEKNNKKQNDLTKKSSKTNLTKIDENNELKSNSSSLDSKSTNESNPIENNSKSRRTKVFKLETSPPSKCEVLVSSIYTSDFVLHNGFYMQIGDIVALFDLNDKEKVFFAQIRAFLTDQYAQKSAVITWLVPTDPRALQIKTAQDFDPSLFVLGPAEEFPRPIECMEFVCRLAELPNVNNCKYDYMNSNYQFCNDLQKHKYNLNDLANRNIKLITKKMNNSIIENKVLWS